MPLPPPIQTYHCICTSLLLTTTHTLSSLPRRKPPTPDSTTTDGAIILPLPSSPPDLTQEDDRNTSEVDPGAERDNEKGKDGERAADEATIPPQGYTILLGLQPDRKASIIRREDGFEKRVLYRCGRCRLVVGYEIVQASSGGPMDVDGGDDSGGVGKEQENAEYKGKVIYILPAGVMSTAVMAAGGKVEGGRRIEEGELGISGRAIGVFE